MPTDKHRRPSKHSYTTKKEPKQIKCSICDALIVDDKDEAILYEGKCQAWLHRHCTGMSKQMFSWLISQV